jgi:putative two-component system response regulator
VKTIFVVDDSDTNLSMAEEALERYYRVMTVPSGQKMFSLLEKIIPDLILLDIEMPEMNGFEAIRLLKANALWAGIPVMFLTGRTDSSVEVHGFELGAVDFVGKPFSTPVLLNRVRTHLNIDEIIHERTLQLQLLRNGIVSVLAEMVENRNKGTGEHIERTMTYIRILINGMLERGVYADEINRWDLETVISSARMHDLGKISIPDKIIDKPGKLSKEEYVTMQDHVLEGERIIDQIAERTGEGEFLTNAKLFASYHHERWDGTGYPRGLAGEEIPLQGRIMAIVDVYDALVSERPYKKAFSEEEALKIIMDSAGKQYDPKIAQVFFEIKDRFIEASDVLFN